MKRIILHVQAEEELTQAGRFYDERQKGLGRQLRNEVRLAARAIQQNPKHYPIHRRDVRKCVIHRFPFSVFFIEEDEFIWIAAIAHHSREPDYWADRRFST